MLLSIPLSILCLFTISIKSDDECCQLKDVGGKLYTLSDRISEDEKERLKCSSTCAYKQEDNEEQKFCFKPGNLESECIEDVNRPVSYKAITIYNQLPEKVTGKISFNYPPADPYKVGAKKNVTIKDLPVGLFIELITAATEGGIACEPYKFTGGEKKLKFDIVPVDIIGCKVIPASQQYHLIGTTEWEENGIKVLQEDFYHHITKEAILKTPAHGNNLATTMIFQSSKARSGAGGLMVTAAGEECVINELPEELGVDPEHMIVEQSQRSSHKRKTRQSSSKSYYVLRHVTSTQVNPSNETLPLTETMKDACKGKTVFYNNEHLVVEEADYTNDTIQNLRTEVAERSFKSLVTKKREVQSDSMRQRPSCTNMKFYYSNEATRNCGTWRYSGIQNTTAAGVTKPVSFQLFNHIRSAWQIVVECCGDDGTSSFPCSSIPFGPPTDDGEQAFATAFYLTYAGRRYGCPGKSKYCEWDPNSTKYDDLTGYPGACTSTCTSKCQRPGSCPKCYGWTQQMYNC